jgi:hypothetical protein
MPTKKPTKKTSPKVARMKEETAAEKRKRVAEEKKAKAKR